MAKVTHKGLVPLDDPMFSGSPEMFSRRTPPFEPTATGAESASSASQTNKTLPAAPTRSSIDRSEPASQSDSGCNPGKPEPTRCRASRS